MKPNLLTVPRWKIYTSYAFIFVFAILIGIKSLRYFDDDRLFDLYFYLACLWFGVGYLAIEFASNLRNLDQRQDAFAKQAALDAERIWKLEATIAELKGSGKPTT